MSWKTILPKKIDVNTLSLDQCRDFKNLYGSLNRKLKGPLGFRIFFKMMHYLAFYAICCVFENKFPALNKCWNELSPLFGGNDFDNEWFFLCWLCCDFPLASNSNRVLIDEFIEFVSKNADLPKQEKDHYLQFCSIMKKSRLGLYQEVLSSSKVTKFQELFTDKVVKTVRSVPEYEHGEVFLTRIVSYLGDSFQIHNPQCFPPDYKDHIINMVKNKLFYISETGNDAHDYEQFMKLAGPYWMSCTHPENDVEIFNPDHHNNYYSTEKREELYI